VESGGVCFLRLKDKNLKFQISDFRFQIHDGRWFLKPSTINKQLSTKLVSQGYTVQHVVTQSGNHEQRYTNNERRFQPSRGKSAKLRVLTLGIVVFKLLGDARNT